LRFFILIYKLSLVGRLKKPVATPVLGCHAVFLGVIMREKREMAEEVFAAMLDQAIEDLKLSGLDPGEIYSIVEENFGMAYARRFCTHIKR